MQLWDESHHKWCKFWSIYPQIWHHAALPNPLVYSTWEIESLDKLLLSTKVFWKVCTKFRTKIYDNAFTVLGSLQISCAMVCNFSPTVYVTPCCWFGSWALVFLSLEVGKLHEGNDGRTSAPQNCSFHWKMVETTHPKALTIHLSWSKKSLKTKLIDFSQERFPQYFGINSLQTPTKPPSNQPFQVGWEAIETYHVAKSKMSLGFPLRALLPCKSQRGSESSSWQRAAGCSWSKR